MDCHQGTSLRNYDISGEGESKYSLFIIDDVISTSKEMEELFVSLAHRSNEGKNEGMNECLTAHQNYRLFRAYKYMNL